MALTDLTVDQQCFALGVNLGAKVILMAWAKDCGTLDNILKASRAVAAAMNKIYDTAPDSIDETARLFAKEMQHLFDKDTQP